MFPVPIRSNRKFLPPRLLRHTPCGLPHMQGGAAPDGECTCVCAMHVGGECPAHEEAKKFFTFRCSCPDPDDDVGRPRASCPGRGSGGRGRGDPNSAPARKTAKSRERKLLKVAYIDSEALRQNVRLRKKVAELLDGHEATADSSHIQYYSLGAHRIDSLLSRLSLSQKDSRIKPAHTIKKSLISLFSKRSNPALRPGPPPKPLSN